MNPLGLTDQATEGFATFYGWTTGGDVSAADFTTQKLLDRVQSDLEEKRNRDAIAAAQAIPVPAITTDQGA